MEQSPKAEAEQDAAQESPEPKEKISPTSLQKKQRRPPPKKAADDK